ncbi:uncharacterized protein K02A2.6-like [Culex quinquefasciatus]|uniref:uncharacterized protein K02A2.6-like n=1 Tax=Culex quinquefasciatus TaxID=7176 RepID=UPI0018E368B0|nr:uncharacterized protein K02A2.6-like [Culex quinquefasciatus]
MSSDPELKNAILKLTNLIATQQEQIAALQRANANPSGSEKIIESLATAIEEFRYDPDDGIFFDAWFARYEDVFKEDGMHLDDKAKVRLLLRKIGTQFHERYVNSILPKHPRDFKFDETITKLKKLFGRQTSLFHARYQCLQYAKNEADDFSSYAASVNRHCEAFQLKKLSSDQFKALRFVCGLQSPRDAEIRTRLISKLEAEEANPQPEPPAEGAAPRLTLENLVEECHRIINLKQDTQLVEKTEKLNIHAVAKQPRPTATEKKVPSSPCWLCGDMHYVRDCSYKDHMCSRCKRQGHKEGYCSMAEQKSSKQVEQPRSKDFVMSKGIRLVKQTDLKQKRKYIRIGLNGTTVQMQLDSASDITMISKNVWAQIGQPHIHTADVNAVGAAGGRINIIGKFNANITVQSVTKEGYIYVTEDPDFNVMGIDTIEAFDLWSVPFNSLCAMSPDQHHESLGRCNSVQLRAKNLVASTDPFGHSACTPSQQVNEAVVAPEQRVDLAVLSPTYDDHHVEPADSVPGLGHRQSPM